jgi:hypothetical protein
MDPTAVDIHKFLPESYQGSVIIIMRLSQVGIGHYIQITKLENLRDSLEILSNRSSREGLIHGKPFLYLSTALTSILDPDTVRLAEKLDGLPLILATAGQYLYKSAISFSEYLRQYKELWARLQETSPELSSYKDRTLYSI